MSDTVLNVLSSDSLPALAGTEKQVAWATAIRNQLLTGICGDGQRLHPLLIAENERVCSVIGKDIAKITSAKFIIENRDRLPAAVLQLVYGLKKELASWLAGSISKAVERCQPNGPDEHKHGGKPCIVASWGNLCGPADVALLLEAADALGVVITNPRGEKFIQTDSN